jgi:hypothetical protein
MQQFKPQLPLDPLGKFAQIAWSEHQIDGLKVVGQSLGDEFDACFPRLSEVRLRRNAQAQIT